METRRIEFTEPVKLAGGRNFEAGDRKSFPKAEADEYIRLGWAKDPETGEQGDRKPGAQKLNVNSTTQVPTA